MLQPISAVRRLAIFLLPAAALLAQSNAFDPAIFKAPPAMYRGHAMWNFNLSTLNEASVVSGIQEMAKLNYGGFFIEAGGRANQGVVFLSDEYFRFYKTALEEARKQRRLPEEVWLFSDEVLPRAVVRHRPADRRRARGAVRVPRRALS